MGKVKFYSINDLSVGFNLLNIEEKIKQYEDGKEPQDVSEFIEIYNIKQYFDNKIYRSNWSKEMITRYTGLVNNLYSKGATFFKSISDNNIIAICNIINEHNYRGYYQDFWKLIENFKVYEHISPEKFKEVISLPKFGLYNILINKNLVSHFGQSIKEHMIYAYNQSVEWLLNEYEVEHDREHKTHYFPKELTSADKEMIVNSYIDDANPNWNYLQLICNIQSNPDKMEISPKTILKARRRFELESNKLFAKNAVLIMETHLRFSKTQEEEKIVNYKGSMLEATYSLNWIEKNNDFATLLNNFIWLFEFVDIQMRFVNVSQPNKMSALVEGFTMRSKNDYIKSSGFDGMELLNLLQMTEYYNVLDTLNIRLESIIEWFFKDYLKIEFGANKFKIDMPSESSTYLEKCTTIMPALEFVLKQFSLFVEDGDVDLELINIRSSHLVYEKIPSRVKTKYIYGCGEKFKKASSLLFSDQSHLTYHSQEEKSYNNFVEFLKNVKLPFHKFEIHQQKDINWLLENKYLTIRCDNVEINNLVEVNILRELYFNEVISFWKYSKQAKNIINALEHDGVVEMKSSLFSKPESDYINYLLNKSKFNNGLDLRNMYSHLQPFNEDEQKIHKQNYMILLKLVVLTVIKINDDFCIAQENDTKPF